MVKNLVKGNMWGKYTHALVKGFYYPKSKMVRNIVRNRISAGPMM
jgi:hypothetical protein